MYSLVLNVKHLITLVFQGNLNGTLDDVFEFEDQCYAASVHSSPIGNKGIHPTASGLYFISSPDSDKVYVGSTSNLARRRSQHYSQLESGHDNPNLRSLSDKTNRDNFRFTSMEIYVDRETLYQIEQRLYDQLHTANLILNTGFDVKAAWKGREIPEDAKVLMSLAKVGKTVHDNQKKAMAKLWEDEDYRKRMSAGAKARMDDPELRQKLIEANSKPRSQEHRAKIASTLKGGTKSNSRRVSVKGEEYTTVNHAVEATDIPGGTLRRWLNSTKDEHKDYYFV